MTRLLIVALLTCVSCASSTTPDRGRWTGTLEPIWWGRAPLYGESPEDPYATALVLRFDTPVDGVTWAAYSSRDDLEQVEVDVLGSACIGGRASVEGTYTLLEHEHIPAVIIGARVVSCEKATPELPAPLGAHVTLTGELRRRWWFGEPGYGVDPMGDKIEIGSAIVVDGVPVHLRGLSKPPAFERGRRTLFACDGQTVSVTGDLRAPKDSRYAMFAVLDDAVLTQPCPSPQIDRGLLLPPKPMPVSWLEAADVASPADPPG